MVVQNVVFGILAVVMVIAAVRVVTTNNIVHAALYLVAVLAGAAGLFILLTAEFVAWVQVLIYIGAVVILFLFGIMLTRAPMRPSGRLDNDQRWVALVASLLLVGVLAALILDAFGGDEIVLTAPTSTTEVADSLFRTYLVPFEVVSMLLLGALVGAVALAKRD